MSYTQDNLFQQETKKFYVHLGTNDETVPNRTITVSEPNIDMARNAVNPGEYSHYEVGVEPIDPSEGDFDHKQIIAKSDKEAEELAEDRADWFHGANAYQTVPIDTNVKIVDVTRPDED